MAYAVFGWDGEDDGAAARRMAARERHLAILTEWARDGRLALGVPLFTAAGKVAGSLMILEVPDQAGLDAYLAAEPFNDGTDPAARVWQRVEARPFRIAPLPYRPLPQPGTPMATSRTHTVILAMDGTDPGAEQRRLGVREAHMARVKPMAADGTLSLGGAILDRPEGRMIGSVVVLARDNDAAAREWMAADPYVTGGVWRDVTLYGTRFAPLPYRKLPGAA
ncbi:YciI family protein [Siccirubricoccus phaeus]|uniref:YciI family protein n=1 Tax=Siccirubricoccus phaeus TaxID=2595053 RepID=UPI0011F217B2|nr:YciI family protein [Siccirubricoccus phaeus]